MQPITFDVLYWPGLKGGNPDRIELENPERMVIELKALLKNPTVRAVQVTVEKTHSGEFGE